eukprot:5940428-Prymnesium_polylepis.1
MGTTGGAPRDGGAGVHGAVGGDAERAATGTGGEGKGGRVGIARGEVPAGGDEAAGGGGGGAGGGGGGGPGQTAGGGEEGDETTRGVEAARDGDARGAERAAAAGGPGGGLGNGGEE